MQWKSLNKLEFTELYGYVYIINLYRETYSYRNRILSSSFGNYTTEDSVQIRTGKVLVSSLWILKVGEGEMQLFKTCQEIEKVILGRGRLK